LSSNSTLTLYWYTCTPNLVLKHKPSVSCTLYQMGVRNVIITVPS